MVGQHKVQRNAKKIKVPREYVMMEKKRVNIALGQDSECVLMSLSCESKLPFILSSTVN